MATKEHELLAQWTEKIGAPRRLFELDGQFWMSLTPAELIQFYLPSRDRPFTELLVLGVTPDGETIWCGRVEVEKRRVGEV